MGKENIIDINLYRDKKESDENTNSVHIPGIRNGYVYGRLFRSSSVQGQVVLNIGRKEYPIDEAEIWNGERFVVIKQISSLDYSYYVGLTARLKSSDIKDENWIVLEY